jgi:hypothetical protein
MTDSASGLPATRTPLIGLLLVRRRKPLTRGDSPMTRPKRHSDVCAKVTCCGCLVLSQVKFINDDAPPCPLRGLTDEPVAEIVQCGGPISKRRANFQKLTQVAKPQAIVSSISGRRNKVTQSARCPGPSLRRPREFVARGIDGEPHRFARSGFQAGVPSSNGLSVSTRTSEPSARMTEISPYG